MPKSALQLFSAILAALFFFLISGGGKHERASFGVFNKGVLLFAGVIGLVLGLYQRVHIAALEKIDSGFLYPTYSGMQTLAMTLIGILMFKDRLSLRQKLGIVCGIICVVLMNVRFFKLF